MNSRREIETLFTGFFSKDEFDFENTYGINTEAVLSKQVVDEEPHFQTYLKDCKGHARFCFANSIIIHRAQKKIFLLGNSCVWKGIFHTWKSYLKMKVMN